MLLIEVGRRRKAAKLASSIDQAPERMRIRAGFKISYRCPQPTPMILALSVHPSRRSDLLAEDRLRVEPFVPVNEYRDGFGNICHVLRAPQGRLTLSSDFLIRDSGKPDDTAPSAAECPLEALPVDTLVYLLGSRYCETDRLSDTAWSEFAKVTPGWSRVQAICDFVHNHVAFGYGHADPRKTAFDAFREKKGVCRDFAHLAVAFCRCMNIPARYCTGYLGDIGVPPEDSPMDFSAWFEAYLGGRWYTFDARHNVPRIGRILIARGRDATDVAITTSFGACELAEFEVVTDEVVAANAAAS
jgi:transglutaminase-like putative cysteine protease